MKTNIPIISFLALFLILSCSLNKDFNKYIYGKNDNGETVYLFLKKNNTINNTIYIYFKNHKYETKKKYITDSLYNNYQANYKFTLKKSNKYIYFKYNSHEYGKGNLHKNLLIEKNKKFLKKIKKKLFTFKDFENKEVFDINSFYHSNNFKTIYLIDKDENKNGKIYLRKVGMLGNFPIAQ